MSNKENILKLDTLSLNIAYFKVVIRYGKEVINYGKTIIITFPGYLYFRMV